MKYKNILLSLGTLTTIIAPISAMIACGEKDKVVVVTVEKEAEKLQSFISTTDPAEITIQVGENSKNLTNLADKSVNIAKQYATINGVNVIDQGLTKKLSKGITISKVILETAYDSNTYKIVFAVTLAKGTATIIKNITITFAEDLKVERDKLKDHFISQVNVASLGSEGYDFTSAVVSNEVDLATHYKLITEWNAIDTSTKDTDESKGITEALASEIEVSNVVLKTKYDAITHQIVFVVTLGKSTDRVANNSKEVAVTFAKDLKVEKTKLQDFTSIDLVGKVGIALENTTAGPTDVKDKYNAITESNATGDNKGLASALTGGITISKVTIKTKYDTTTKAIVFIVTLAKGADRVTNNSKEVTVTFA